MEVKGNNRNISRLLIYKWHNWFPDCAFDLGDATRSGGRLLCKYNTKSPIIWTRHLTVREVMSNYDVIKFLVLNILTDDSEWYSRVFDSWLMRCKKPAGDQVKDIGYVWSQHYKNVNLDWCTKWLTHGAAFIHKVFMLVMHLNYCA